MRLALATLLVAAACTLAAPAEAQTYRPKLPCTAYNLSLKVPKVNGQPADSAAIARHCGFERQRWTDSVAAVKAAKLAATAAAAAVADSLAKLYPVDAKLGPCWRFNAPAAVSGIREPRSCFRWQLADQELPDSLLLQGALSTWYKGAWSNRQITGGKPSPMRATDGSLTRAVDIQ